MEEQLSDDFSGDIIKVEPAELHDVQDGEQQRFNYTQEEVRQVPANGSSQAHAVEDDAGDNSQMQQMFLINRGTLQELYSLDMDPQRKDFLDHYLEFMKQRGTPLSRVPSVGRQMLDLYKLFVIVRNLGGVHEVIQNRRWNTVRKFLGIPATLTSAAYTLKARYLKLLYAYDCSQRGCVVDKNLANFDFQSVKTERGLGSNEIRHHSDDRRPPFHLPLSTGFQRSSPLAHGSNSASMAMVSSRIDESRGSEQEDSRTSAVQGDQRISPPYGSPGDSTVRVSHPENGSPTSADLIRCSMVDPKSSKSHSEGDSSDGSTPGQTTTDMPSVDLSSAPLARVASNGGRDVPPSHDADDDFSQPGASRSSQPDVARKQEPHHPLASPPSPSTSSGEIQLTHYDHRQLEARVTGRTSHCESSQCQGSTADVHGEARLSRQPLHDHHRQKAPLDRFIGSKEQIHHPHGGDHTNTGCGRSVGCCEAVHGHRLGHSHSPTSSASQYNYRPGASRVMYEHHPQVPSSQKRYYPEESDSSPSFGTPAKRRTNHYDESPVWESTCIVGFKIHRKFDNKLVLTVDVNGDSYSGTLAKNP